VLFVILIGLADVLRSAGLTVHEIPNWKTRGHGPFVALDSIICHHTAGPDTGDFPSLPVVRDGKTGLAGPLANLGLGRSGDWWVIAAGVGWHAGDVIASVFSNTHAIGIEAEATGLGSVHDWPPVQMASYARGCAALCDAYGILVGQVRGHKEVCAPTGRKIDPSFDMSQFRRTVQNYLGGDVPLTNDDLAKIQTVVNRAVFTERIGKDSDPASVTLESVLLSMQAKLDVIVAALKVPPTP
jgi:hypothetical protein